MFLYRVSWIQYCDVIVLEKLRFSPSIQKPEKQISALEDAFKKLRFSVILFTGYVWKEGESAMKIGVFKLKQIEPKYFKP